MILRIALVLLVAGCAAAPTPTPVAIARPAAECRMTVARLHQMVNPKAHLTEVTDAAGFLEKLNHMPPESEYEADRVFIAHAGDTARVFLFTHDCLTDAVEADWSDIQEMLGRDI